MNKSTANKPEYIEHKKLLSHQKKSTQKRSKNITYKKIAKQSDANRHQVAKILTSKL